MEPPRSKVPTFLQYGGRQGREGNQAGHTQTDSTSHHGSRLSQAGTEGKNL